jgi:hypothetical protein
VSPDAVRRWVEAPEGPEQAAFAVAVRRAERAAEARMVGYVMRRAQKDPKHAEWWLERKHPGHWAARTEVVVRDAEGARVREALAWVDALEEADRAAVRAILERVPVPGPAALEGPKADGRSRPVRGGG